MRPLAVLRPEPGNTATVARAAAAGFATVPVPLFAIRAIDWSTPDAGQYDALILTSANTLRFGGAGLLALRALPVLAVGPHTAAAARAAGFDVMATGDGDGAAIARFAAACGIARALHLTGRDRTLKAGGVIATVLPVYASVTLPLSAGTVQRLRGTCALLHSSRAARRLTTLLYEAGIDRAHLTVAAFSPAVAAAADIGWAGIATAAAPSDEALLAAAHTLAETTGD